MTFSDIFQSSFLDMVTAVSLFDMALAMLVAFGLGVFIFWMYKRTYQGVMYSTSFGVTLVALTMITTLIILAVTSNIILSLGMVGALSIVRFRTAIKEPLDIAFLFWSIAVGIVLAAGMIPLAVFGSLFIGLVINVFANRQTSTRPFLAIIDCTDSAAEAQAGKILTAHATRVSLKSKTARAGHIELTYELRLQDGQTDFINRLQALKDVTSAVLVSFNGEYL